MAESLFDESLYSVEELELINQCVDNGHLNNLTCVFYGHQMTKEKEKDIARVLNILRPQQPVTIFESLREKALEEKKKFLSQKEVFQQSKEQAMINNQPAKEKQATKGRPRKVVVEQAI